MNSNLLVVSFGFKYGDTPTDGAVIDVRKLFQRNPYRNKQLRYLRGTDEPVQEDIKQTPRFQESYDALRRKVSLAIHADKQDIVYLGCTGEHHRSVFLAESIAKRHRCRRDAPGYQQKVTGVNTE